MNRFDDALLTRIIGPGVTGIFCLPMQSMAGASSYDHKREHFAKHGGVRFADVDGEPPCVPVWDFVIHRGDGERVRLHPNQTNKKVSISMMGAPIPTAADGPQAGRGLSDGRGTYQHMLRQAYPVTPTAKCPPAVAGLNILGHLDSGERSNEPIYAFNRQAVTFTPKASADPPQTVVATASSADTRGDGADWRGWQDWRGAWSSLFRTTVGVSTHF